MPAIRKKIPQPAPPVYMPPPVMEPPSYMQPPPGVYAPTMPPPGMEPSYMQPPPGMPPPGMEPQTPIQPSYGPGTVPQPPAYNPSQAYAIEQASAQQAYTQSAYAQQRAITPAFTPTSDNDNIITHTEYELLIDENKPDLVMLRAPEKDKVLEKINASVFDEMQKVIDDINFGYDYVKKTKILMAKLEHFPYLRKYENLIRKATHLDGESDPYSLEKLQLRVCNDPWLALFFKQADQTRINRSYEKKLTWTNWKRLKQTIIGYYFNYFLQKQSNVIIKQKNLPSFCVYCFVLHPVNANFIGFNVSFHDNQDKKQPLMLADKYLEDAAIHKDDLGIGKYSDIFDLLNRADYIFQDDKDNEEVVNLMKDNGSKNVSGDVSGSVSQQTYLDQAKGFFYKNVWNHPYNTRTNWIQAGIYGMAAYKLFQGGDASSLVIPLPLIPNGTMPFDGTAVVSGAKKTAVPSTATAPAPPSTATAPAPPHNRGITIGQIEKVGDGFRQTGFFFTLCLFVDEALENCRQQYEARNGPINWDMTSQMTDKPVNLSDLIEISRKRKELNGILTLIPDGADKNRIALKICKMSIAEYASIRGEIDIELHKELIMFVVDPKTPNTKKNYADEDAFKVDLAKYKNIYSKLTAKSKLQTDWANVFENADTKKTWKWTANNANVKYEADGRMSSIPDGGHTSTKKSPTKSKKDGYKRSPQYDGLKSAYKDGRISKDQFKDGKRLIKRSFPRVASRA